MYSVELVGIFGDVKKRAILYQARDGATWEIFLDKFRQGSITSYQGKAIIQLNSGSVLRGEDIIVLLEALWEQGIANLKPC
jgi:hypothetical protein